VKEEIYPFPYDKFSYNSVDFIKEEENEKDNLLTIVAGQ
jgi:hypothetical protein